LLTGMYALWNRRIGLSMCANQIFSS
jgi:hypothetical protein